jgi:signal transduction histidine kinase
VKWLDSVRFLERLNTPASQAERERTEFVLAAARAILTGLSAIAVYVDPTDPLVYSRIAFWMMIGWTAYCVAILIWLRTTRLPKWAPYVLHGLDILWPAVISLFTQGPNSPFFAYTVFALAAAAFRWGLPECLATAVVGIGLLDVQALMLTGGPPAWELTLLGEFDVNGLIIRCSYLLVLSLLIGYFGESEKERRAESIVLNRILRTIRAEQGLGTSLHSAVNEFLRIYVADRAYIVMQDLTRDRVFLWQADAKMPPDTSLFATEVSSAQSSAYLMPEFLPTYYALKTEAGVQVLALRDGDLKELSTSEFPTLPFHKGEANSVLSTATALGQEWFARLYLVNARVGSNREQELQLAERILRQVAPALYSVFLMRRLRKRAGAIERARVARELHDGAIQSLISAEMQVDVLRRRTEREHQPMSAELEHIQYLLRREVLNLRELMQQMKPLELGPEQLLDHMADMVDRFRRDTGISAQFTTELQDVPLSPHACRELVRIVQEGLVNVRKHSAAQHVLVRFGRENGFWKLTIADDGTGFGFDGRLSHKELVNSARGPAIIKERVRNIGGELNLESHPGEGARLEITIPQKGHIIHG